MRISSEPLSIDSLVRREQLINPRPQYQRTPVWNEFKRKLLIDSILRGYDIPKIYLRRISEDDFEYEVVDGQQRLRAIWSFCKDDFELDLASRTLPFGDLSGKRASQLSATVQDKLFAYSLHICVVEEATDAEIADLFLRLQEGVGLTPPEKRNAMLGSLRDFIVNVSSGHRVFDQINIEDKRFAHADLLAHVTCLELADGPCHIKARDLSRMYDDQNATFYAAGKTAGRIKKYLNFMARVLSDSPPEMSIKWGFVDLYLLISKFYDRYVISGRHRDFAKFYRDFESQRRAHMGDPQKLLETGDPWDREMYRYIECFRAQGGVRQNISTRHDVYARWFLKCVPGLKRKDRYRFFSKEQKLVIWRRDGDKCARCKKKVKYVACHVDHKIAHARGGATTIENGQILCMQCNQEKAVN